ncbi:MAG: hypothetical protein H6807_14000 [Planctomycetes bacterium]|nr:hypothetical protein [Planctomycetota bacterium]
MESIIRENIRLMAASVVTKVASNDGPGVGKIAPDLRNTIQRGLSIGLSLDSMFADALGAAEQLRETFGSAAVDQAHELLLGMKAMFEQNPETMARLRRSGCAGVVLILVISAGLGLHLLL